MSLFDKKPKTPVKIVGVLNPLVALLAKEAGFKALYLSGASLSSQWGMPDLGVLTLNDVVESARRILLAVDLPLIVDIDNGWNHPLLLQRGGRELKQIGVYAAQIEDQAGAKRCGHLTIKELVSKEEMSEKIKLLKSCGIKVLARTDALGVEGMAMTIERMKRYEKAGCDAHFLEAVTDLKQIKAVKKEIKKPLVINMTEFGKTPMWNQVDAHFLLYPMTVNRVMYKAAEESLKDLMKGKRDLKKMMTRDKLYEVIHYREEEKKL